MYCANGRPALQILPKSQDAENEAGKLVPDLLLFFKKTLYKVK